MMNEPVNSMQQLIDTSRILFARSGYDAVSTRKIASYAGLSYGLYHFYFPTKKSILNRVLDSFLTRWHECLPDPKRYSHLNDEILLDEILKGMGGFFKIMLTTPEEAESWTILLSRKFHDPDIFKLWNEGFRLPLIQSLVNCFQMLKPRIAASDLAAELSDRILIFCYDYLNAINVGDRMSFSISGPF